MSRPFVLGSDVALWIRRVQWTIGFRGPRMPVSQIPGGFEVCGPAIFDQVRSTGRSLRELSTCALLTTPIPRAGRQRARNSRTSVVFFMRDQKVAS